MLKINFDAQLRYGATPPPPPLVELIKEVSLQCLADTLFSDLSVCIGMFTIVT